MAEKHATWEIPPDEDWHPIACFIRNARSVPFSTYLAMALVLSVIFFWQQFAFVVWSGGVLSWLFLRRKPDPKVLRMAQFPPPGDQFPVDISLYRAGILYGEDSGIATFIDGWLLFEGLHTSFSLRRRDAELLEEKYVPDRRIPRWLTWYEHDDWHHFGLRPLPVFYDDEGRRIQSPQDGFESAFRSWVLEPRTLKGHPIFPPIDPHPQGYYRAWIYRFWSLAFGLAALASLLALPFQDIQGFLIFCVAMLIVGSVTSGALYVTYRRRLDLLVWMASGYEKALAPRNPRLLPRRKQT